jgi:hypothetical protein
LTSHLTARVRDQAETATRREARTAALYALSREVASATGVPEVLEAIVTQVSHIRLLSSAQCGTYVHAECLPDPDLSRSPLADADYRLQRTVVGVLGVYLWLFPHARILAPVSGTPIPCFHPWLTMCQPMKTAWRLTATDQPLEARCGILSAAQRSSPEEILKAAISSGPRSHPFDNGRTTYA